MAYFGVSYVILAKLAVGTEKYSDGIILGMCGTSVTPNYADSSLDVDDRVGHHKKSFQDADITVDVEEIPLKAGEMLFGHKFETSQKNQKSNIDDVESYVGYGFVGAEETADGSQVFTACWLPKCRFSEGADDWKTKGKNIQLTAQKLSGTAMALKDGTWREKQQFDTRQEALDFLKQKAGITNLPS